MLVDGPHHDTDNPLRPDLRYLPVAAVASIAAGAIHAVAAGSHSEHAQAVWLFVALAAAQIGWGVLALARPGRAVAALGAGLAVAALAGWAAAKAVGLGFVDGMEAAEAVQWSDGIAAALALLSLLAALVAMFGVPAPASLAPVLATVVLAAAVPGMLLAGDHAHSSGGHGDDHAAADVHVAGDDHDEADHADTAHADGDHDDGEGHDTSVVAPVPYDPALPIDLGGVEGVTPEQQAAAENLVAVTLLRLPQFADPAVAEAHGYHSIGDGVTGYEHYINWDTINDDTILDPDAPESLVYQVRGGEKTLVAAMFMLPDGQTLDDVPELGGRLTQWHVHDNLCYSMASGTPRVAGVRAPDAECPEGTVRGRENAMIHVWIVPHECGPFSALEGVAGGRVPDGEERWCDHAHGA